MSHTDCEHILEQLPEYQAGALPDLTGKSVEAHLADCATCRGELKALERTSALLSATPARQPGRDLWPDIAEQLSPRRQAREWWRALVPSRPAWQALAAAALVLVVAALVLVPHGPTTGPEIVLPHATDDEANLIAGWHAEASLANAVSNRYALAFAVAARSEQTEAPQSP